MAGLLAVVLDQLIHLLELAARQRSRRLAWVGAVGLLLVVAGSLFYPVSRYPRSCMPILSRIASGPFTEQHILNEVLALHLAAAGLSARSADRHERRDPAQRPDPQPD